MNYWIIPSNTRYYDVFGAFRDLPTIYWRQHVKGIEVGDIVYIYVTAPYKRIMFKCEVLGSNIPSTKETEESDAKYNREDSNTSDIGTVFEIKLIGKVKPSCDLSIANLRLHGERSSFQGTKRILDSKYLKFIDSAFVSL